MKKKLLFILGSFRVGGGENMVCELITNIDKTKFEIFVICYDGRKLTPAEKIIENSAKVFYLNCNGRVSVSKYIKVANVIRKIKPDIVHGHLGGVVYASLWALLHKNDRIVLTAHTSPNVEFSGKVGGVLRLVFKRKQKNVILVAVSKENHKKLSEFFSVDERVCKFINNGIDISKYFRMPHKDFTFINVARQDENKNQISIIRAFYRLSKEFEGIRLILAGNGPCHEMLVAETERLGVSPIVEFPGMVSDAENYYARADVYVQTSFIEALPLSILEAMAAGLPIVSTNVGGIKDVVSQNGELIPVDDDALYMAMKSQINKTNEEKKKMSLVSLACVQDYSSRKMAEGYEFIYNWLMQC